MNEICSLMTNVRLTNDEILNIVKNDIYELVNYYKKLESNSNDNYSIEFQANPQIDIHINSDVMRQVYEYLFNDNKGYDLLIEELFKMYPGTYVDLKIVDGIMDIYLEQMYLTLE